MSIKTKIWLITAISLILIGGIVFGGAMAMLGWDFSKLSTVKYEESKYEIKDDYNDISINTSGSEKYVIRFGYKYIFKLKSSIKIIYNAFIGIGKEKTFIS